MPYKPESLKPHWVPERKPFKMNLDNQSFYNSYRWRKVSTIFRKKNPLCVWCKEKEIVKPSEVTDHIVSIRNGGAKFAEENLQALCHSCHNSKSGREGAESQKLTVAKPRKNIDI